ncbi:MAG: outer membrane beta-barrel protein, partial [Gammaproteobacteria bacterium]
MNIKLSHIVFAATLLGITTAALAGKKTPTLGEVLGASGVEISGYIDTSYTYSDSGVSPVSGRVFDTEDNSFNLNMIGLSISKLPSEGFGGAVVLNAGEDANVTAASGSGSDDEFDVQQAYVNYGTGARQFMFGKFATLQGAEVIESKDNWNFSRSILFGSAIPFTHTGIRVSHTVNDALSLTAGINNGWDNLKDDNDAKSLELQAY